MAENIKIITDKQDIVAIADAVRNKLGTTAELSLGGIVSGINSINQNSQSENLDSVLNTQEAKLNELLEALDGKAAASAVVEPLEITENGIYIASDGVDGYSPITVNVASSGSEMEDAMVEGTLTEYTNDRVTTIGNSVFAYWTHLTTANFPACETIGSYAFRQCLNLTTVSFPICTTIGGNAFLQCSNLTTVSFPICTTIDSYAFNQCSNLTTVNFPICTTINSYAFHTCPKLTTANFPVCETIGSYAIAYCTKLTTISFPKCATIGSYAFRNCYNLVSLYLNASKVCALAHSNAFSSTPIGGYSASAGKYGSIYVPASLVSAYKTATNWTYYSNRIIGV